MRKSRPWPAFAVLTLLLAGCVGLPRHVEKTRSTALPDPSTTTLGRLIAAEDEGRNLSGVRLLASGEEALATGSYLRQQWAGLRRFAATFAGPVRRRT